MDGTCGGSIWAGYWCLLVCVCVCWLGPFCDFEISAVFSTVVRPWFPVFCFKDTWYCVCVFLRLWMHSISTVCVCVCVCLSPGGSRRLASGSWRWTMRVFVAVVCGPPCVHAHFCPFNRGWHAPFCWVPFIVLNAVFTPRWRHMVLASTVDALSPCHSQKVTSVHANLKWSLLVLHFC